MDSKKQRWQVSSNFFISFILGDPIPRAQKLYTAFQIDLKYLLYKGGPDCILWQAIKDPFKHLWWSCFFNHYFGKIFHLNVWQGPK